jgi:hypothetical protein
MNRAGDSNALVTYIQCDVPCSYVYILPDTLTSSHLIDCHHYFYIIYVQVLTSETSMQVVHPELQKRLGTEQTDITVPQRLDIRLTR